jgi:predicted helicase
VNYVFPLYLYPNNDGAQGILLPDHHRRANLSKEFLEALAAALDLPVEAGGLPRGVSPRDVFNYIYAILHAGSFRTRYADFLQQDFCRIPLTRDRDRFRRFASIGNELTGIHLMTHPALECLITEFPETGTNRVESTSCDPQGRAWINRQQYFAGVPKRVWEFKIGGYQVCRQWLKDRKGRELTWSDIQHFQRVVVAVNQTTRLIAEVESCIPGWPLG